MQIPLCKRSENLAFFEVFFVLFRNIWSFCLNALSRRALDGSKKCLACVLCSSAGCDVLLTPRCRFSSCVSSSIWSLDRYSFIKIFWENLIEMNVKPVSQWFIRGIKSFQISPSEAKDLKMTWLWSNSTGCVQNVVMTQQNWSLRGRDPSELLTPLRSLFSQALVCLTSI